MKNIWVIKEENHGILVAAETPLDAIRWLVKCGWLELDNPDAVSWYDGEKKEYYELSVRESAEKFGVSIESFLEQILAEGISGCEMSFSCSCVEWTGYDGKPLE